MKKILSGVAGMLLLSTLPLSAQADYISDINIDGGFDIYGFSLIPDGSGGFLSNSDFNPLTYTLDLHDVTGTAEFTLPPSGAGVEVYATGGAAANFSVGYDGARPAVPSLWLDDLIFSGIFGVAGITLPGHSFDFDNGIYTATSGSFSTPIPDLPPGFPGFPGGYLFPGSLDISYDILNFDGDAIANDIRLTIIETPAGIPSTTVSYVLNGLDAAGNANGRIDGTFAIGAQLRAVPEPATLALFGLGLAGLAMRLRKKQA